MLVSSGIIRRNEVHILNGWLCTFVGSRMEIIRIVELAVGFCSKELPHSSVQHVSTITEHTVIQ